MLLPIFIPSRSRWQRSLTLERLGRAVLVEPRFVALVVPAEQHQQYRALAKQHGITVMSEPGVKGIAATRKLIGRMAATLGYDRFIMFDDDLRFMHRANKNVSKLLVQNSSEDCVKMLAFVERKLDEFAHVSIGPRQGNNTIPGYPIEVCSRSLRALAFRTREFNQCQHGRVAIMEDFDVQLQLLARGLPNAVVTHWVQDQYATNLPGGCSEYRTLELHNKNVMRMHKLWPEVTKPREKENRSEVNVKAGLGKRLELTIYWKKALGLDARRYL